MSWKEVGFDLERGGLRWDASATSPEGERGGGWRERAQQLIEQFAPGYQLREPGKLMEYLSTGPSVMRTLALPGEGEDSPADGEVGAALRSAVSSVGKAGLSTQPAGWHECFEHAQLEFPC